MKITKKLLLILIILLIFPSIVGAESQLELITDEAYLLTDSEYWELNDRARAISEDHYCDIAIITIDDMGYDEDAFDFASSLIEEYDMGYGSQKSILLLFLSMEDGDYALVGHGYGNTVFTDYGKDVMLDKHILPLLGKDKYYEAFLKYLDLSEEYLLMASGGQPFDIDTDPNYGKIALPIKLGITFLIPLLIAFLVTGSWKRKMKTARLATSAGDYISAEGLKLTNQADQFLYHTTSSRKIEKSSSGGGGGGGTSVNSSGYSGRSGKF